MECNTVGPELSRAGKRSQEECKIPGFEASSQRCWKNRFSCHEILAYHSRGGKKCTAIEIVTAMMQMAAIVLVFATIVYIVPHIKYGLHVFHHEITKNHSNSKQETSTTPSGHFDIELDHHRLIDDIEWDVGPQSATWEASETHNNSDSDFSRIQYNDSKSAFSTESGVQSPHENL
jgi:hypothetical protein